jgi:chromosome segregation ATPase
VKLFSGRTAQLETMNRILTESARQRAQRVEELERAIEAHELAKKQLSERIQLLDRMLLAAHTRAKEQDAELTKALIEIATLAPENQRLQAEHAFYARRVAELEEHNRLLTESAIERETKLQEHNRLLTESAIERETKLQHCEAKLTRMEAEIAAVTQEYQHIRAERADSSRRASALEKHGHSRVDGTNEAARDAQQPDRPPNKA